MYARFIKKQLVARNTYRFTFQPEHRLNITAGQFVELTLKVDNVDDRGSNRWFTVSSPPEEGTFSITTKIIDEASRFKKTLVALKSGDKITVSEPMGDFVLPIDKQTPILFVAGGIGVTPYLSILSHLKAVGQKRKIDLLYTVNDIKDAVDISTYEDRITSLRVISSNQDSVKLSSELIFSEFKKNKDQLIYIAGPEGMVETIGKQLLDMGLDSSALVQDFFPGYDS
ncbi:MAG TPA: FAD-dependent oxidoreductase [Candidatus Saccharimonadales bacterium]